MKALKTLIKLNKTKLDKSLKQIKQFEEEKTRLECRKKSFEAEVERETQQYSTSQYAYMLDQYLQTSRQTMRRIDAQLLQILLSIDKLRSVLREQYAELKKFEIALENKKKLALEKQKKIEDKLVDEFNINKFALDQRKFAKQNLKKK